MNLSELGVERPNLYLAYFFIGPMPAAHLCSMKRGPFNDIDPLRSASWPPYL